MENKLNIQITVTDEQMTSLIRGNLENLPDEKLQEIFSNALIEFFKTENGQRLFYSKGYYRSDPEPTRLLTNMVENAVSKDLLKPCVDEFVSALKDNYMDLLRTCMIQTFTNLFFTEMHSATLQAEMRNLIMNHNHPN